MHWDGSQWSVVPSPNPNPNPYYDSNILLAVEAVSSNDVWAVGYIQNPDRGWMTLVEHWDGSQWSVVPSPNLGTRQNYLKGISAISSNDIWAVGYYVAVFGGFGYSQTLIEHWDGSQWRIAPSPNANTDNNELYSVVAISPNDAWAAGAYVVFGGQVYTLIEHWDGVQWSIVPSPNPGTFQSSAHAISATSHNDAWVVGAYNNGDVGAWTFTEHWNGTQWSIVPSPNPGPDASGLWDVAAISATDVWAVGYYSNGTVTLVEHWDGTQWSIVPSPNPSSLDNFLWGVAAVSPNDVWAVGYFDAGLGAGWQTLVEHYASGCATLTPTPTRPPQPTLTLTPTPTSSPSSTSPSTSTATHTVTHTRTPGTTRTPVTTPTPIPTSTSTSTSSPTSSSTPCNINFTDVNQSDYFYEAVRYLYCRGVISGYADGTFRPYNNTTRGQLTKIVVLGFGMPLYTPPTPTFRDVSAADTFYQFIETAYHSNLVSGYTCGGQGEPCPGLYFRPGSQVTRGQLAKIVVLAAGWPLLDPARATFRDVAMGSTFFRYVETAYERGIISGYSCGDGCLEFRPGASATRGQICKIVYLAITQR